MPTTIKQIFDRNTFQNEKVKGWETCRIFKASALESEQGSGEFIVNDGDQIIKNFTTNYNSNFKGTNLIKFTEFEDFNSLRIKANGFSISIMSWINFFLNVYDTSGNLIGGILSNYTEKFEGFNTYPNEVEWFMDLEITFVKDSTDARIILNGNYILSEKNLRNSFMIPFNGSLSFGMQDAFIDLVPYNNGTPTTIKQINIDFVE